MDSFAELPQDKRPPKSIWHNDYKLEEWFDLVFETKSSNDVMEFNLNEVE